MKRINSGVLTVALLVIAGGVWIAGPGSQSAAAQTAVRIFGTLSGAAKAVAVDSTGRLRVIIEGGGAAFDAAVTLTQNALGVTPTDGLRLQNETAAAPGAQQMAPRQCFEGRGWKTDATAASQQVEFCWEMLPVQGTSAPSGNFLLKASINGGAYSTVGTFTRAGALTLVGGLTIGADSIGTSAEYNTYSGAGNTSRTAMFANGGADSGVLLHGQTHSTKPGWAEIFGFAKSYADTSITSLGATEFGTFEFKIGTANTTCVFLLRGSSNAVVLKDDGGNGGTAVCSATQGTASRLNVSWDAGDSRYEMENLLGGTRTVAVFKR